jgi:hypothetical protein
MLHIPVTIETGRAGLNIDFYHPDSPFDYPDKGYDYEALETGQQIGDCRLVLQTNDNEDYRSCAHVMPEVWAPLDRATEIERQGVIDHPQGMGAIGQTSWFVPKFTAQRDLTLLDYLGLQGSEHRRKLAEAFLRPTSWKDYCDTVSPNHCQTPDAVATHAPDSESEESRYFVEGFYTGHFRATEQNDCDKHPTNCTGHIVDYPCGWGSYAQQITHHLDIALESNGPEPNGYSYSQMTEVWAAAK